jgi:hypothetical protein
MSSTFDERAKEFGCAFRIGKYGVSILPKGLGGRRLFSIIPLDGWITDPQAVERIIRENGMEL